jgi:UDP-glucose 4-epimerase
VALRIVVRLDATQLRALVTGGAGFIGSHLVDRLIDRGHDVIVLDNFSTGRTKNLSRSPHRQNLQVVRADIRKIPRSIVKRLRRVDAVCHFAAVTSVQQSVKDPVSTTEVNVFGTLNVLEAAKALKAQRVVFASSAAVYGAPDAFPISETSSIRPMSPYGASKAASEHYVASFEANHGIVGVSLRFFNVYGPRQRVSQYSGAISIFSNRSLDRQTLRIFGDGSQTRDFIFVSDAVDATVAALEKDPRGRVFNIASGSETTILKLAETIRTITQSQSELKFCPPLVGDIPRSVADTTMAQNDLGYSAKTSLEQGLSATIQWLVRERQGKRAIRHASSRNVHSQN